MLPSRLGVAQPRARPHIPAIEVRERYRQSKTIEKLTMTQRVQHSPRLDITTAPRISLLAAGLGVVYGLLGLEVVSPLALLLVMCAGIILFLAWRLPVGFMAMAAAGVGFVCWFGIAWAVALGRLIARCTPPAG